MRNFTVHYDPYDGVSGVTSNVVPLRDAFHWSYSWQTSAATASTVTLQLSNHDGPTTESVPEATWIDRLVLSSSNTWLEGPDGARYARYLRTTNDSGQTIALNKHVR